VTLASVDKFLDTIDPIEVSSRVYSAADFEEEGLFAKVCGFSHSFRINLFFWVNDVLCLFLDQGYCLDRRLCGNRSCGQGV
jgi:hypothetical protein